MANSITLFSGFAGMLDEVYQQASLTGTLDGATELMKQGARVNELIVPTLKMQGMADYSRSEGYIPGDVSLTHETVTCNYDRGRMFTVDAMDDAETAGVAFGQLAGEFIRTQVVPELDAFRFAEYACRAATIDTGSLDDGTAVLSALRTAANALDESEVPLDGRVLFITSKALGLIEDMNTQVSRAVLSRFDPVVRVSPSRFYSGITMNDGVSPDQMDGGFCQAPDAVPMHFLVVHRGAVIQYTKHAEPKTIPPQENQTADAWKFGYRLVSIARVLDKKRCGIYAYHALPDSEIEE